jgi:hypothetical protein
MNLAPTEEIANRLPSGTIYCLVCLASSMKAFGISATAIAARSLSLSPALSNALIFRPHKVFTVSAFEAANDKMAARHVLKMLNERVVHGCAT